MNSRNKCIILGALCAQSGRYTLPTEATKGNPYTCVGCSDNVFVKKGERNIHHFCHYSNSKCKYYEHASESEIHKNAKMRIKSLFEQKCEVSFIRKCKFNSLPINGCDKNPDIYPIPVMTETSKIILEFPFKIAHIGVTYSADVAYIDGNEPLCMIEVCHTHATSKERRVDPWFEVSAKNALEAEVQDNAIQFTCIRQEACDDCVTENNEQRYKNLWSRYHISKRDDDLEFFVRYSLGQRNFKGEYTYDVRYGYYRKERYDHKRIDFDGGDKNNNEIIELFHRHMNHMRVIIQTGEGICDVLIVPDKDKTDYSKTSIACNPLSKNYNGRGTVDIIVDILKCVHKPVPIVNTPSKEMLEMFGNKKSMSGNNYKKQSSMASYLLDSMIVEGARRAAARRTYEKSTS